MRLRRKIFTLAHLPKKAVKRAKSRSEFKGSGGLTLRGAGGKPATFRIRSQEAQAGNGLLHRKLEEIHFKSPAWRDSWRDTVHAHVGAVITIKSRARRPKLLQLAADNLLLVPCHFQTPSIMSAALTVLTFLVYVMIAPPFDIGCYQILSALSPSAPRTCC